MAWVDELKDYAGTTVTGLALLSAAILGAARVVFNLRRDQRKDHAGERQKNGEDVVASGYEKIIEEQRVEIDRLIGIIDRQSVQINDLMLEVSGERQKRYAADEIANLDWRNRDDGLARRVADLEALIATMNGK